MRGQKRRSPRRLGAPVEEVSPKIIRYRERLRVVSYSVMLDAPRELIWFVPRQLPRAADDHVKVVEKTPADDPPERQANSLL
jgi:hypothetical protein